MKKVIKTLAVTFTLLSIISSSTYASSLSQSVFVDRTEVVYPIPADSDVIKPLGNPSRFSLPSKRIKFLVWNLHKGSDAPFKYEFFSLGFDRDIIMGQEIYLDDNMLDVFQLMPHLLFTTATSFFDGKGKIRTGVTNASSVKPSLVKFVRTQNREPVIHSPKVTLITSYPITHSDKKLTVVNIHGINFVSTKVFRQELNRIYESIKDIPSPLVFAGDFNTWNRDRLNILNEYKEKLGLSEAEFTPDNRLTFNGFPLDHFLYTSDIKIIGAKVEEFYQGSDHKPLQVEVEYSPSTFNSNE